MNIDLLFKIAAIGILVAVLYQVLVRARKRRPSNDDDSSRTNYSLNNGYKRSKWSI